MISPPHFFSNMSHLRSAPGGSCTLTTPVKSRVDYLLSDQGEAGHHAGTSSSLSSIRLSRSSSTAPVPALITPRSWSTRWESWESNPVGQRRLIYSQARCHAGLHSLYLLERKTGIEPALEPWQGPGRPLPHFRAPLVVLALLDDGVRDPAQPREPDAVQHPPLDLLRRHLEPQPRIELGPPVYETGARPSCC